MPTLSATGPAGLPKTQEEVQERRHARQARAAEKKKKSRGISKKKREDATKDTASMTTAELLWRGKVERELIDFEPIPAADKFFGQHDGFFIGGVGLIPGPKGGKGAFQAYIKHQKVIERLQAEGFEKAGQGSPHPWYLVLKPGVLSPADKADLRSLTPEKRAMVKANRLAALERKCAVKEERLSCPSLPPTDVELDIEAELEGSF